MRGLGDLSPVMVPDHGSPINPFECRWQNQTPDYANHDVADQVVDTQANDVYAYEWAQTLYLTKLGGWPGTIQSEPWWDTQQTKHDWAYVMQIGEEPKSFWVLPFVAIACARDAPDRWAMELQLD